MSVSKRTILFGICYDLGGVSFVTYVTLVMSNVLLARKGAEILTDEDLVSLPLHLPNDFRQDL
jgi:hypothetical protein